MLEEVDDESTIDTGMLEPLAAVDAETRLLPVGAEMIDGVEIETDDAVEIDGAADPDDAVVIDAGVVTDDGVAIVEAIVEAFVDAVVTSVDAEASGRGASTLRLRSSVAPPHADARTTSAASAKKRRR